MLTLILFRKIKKTNTALVFTLLIPVAGYCQPYPTSEASQLDELSQQPQRDSPEAEKRIRRLIDTASTLEHKAKVQIELARLLTREAEVRLQESEQLYEEILGGALDRHIVLAARNSYGLALLRQQRPEKAASVLAAVEQDLEALPDLGPLIRARYLYNYAVALEHSERVWEALRLYLQASYLDPGFRLATDGAFRLGKLPGANSPRPNRFGEQPLPVFELIELLIENGEYEATGFYLRSLALEQLADNRIREEWPLWFGRYLAIAVRPQDFENEWRPLLALVRLWSSPLAVARLDLIATAYSGALPLILDPSQARVFTAPWQKSAEQATIFSKLLESLGDAWREEGKRQTALAAYSLAWSSAGNWHAAVYLISLVDQAAKELDPDGHIIQSLVNARAKLDSPPRNAKDWRDLSRFHTLVAENIQRHESLAPNAVQQSIVHHLTQAVAAYQEWTARSSRPNSAPKLYANLAAALQQDGQSEAAQSFYITAAEQYLAVGRYDVATELLETSKTLNQSLKAEDPRLERLELRVALQSFRESLGDRIQLQPISESESRVALTNYSQYSATIPSAQVHQSQKVYKVLDNTSSMTNWTGTDLYLVHVGVDIEPKVHSLPRHDHVWIDFSLNQQEARIINAISVKEAFGKALSWIDDEIQPKLMDTQKSFSSFYVTSDHAEAISDSQNFIFLMKVPEGSATMPATVTYKSTHCSHSALSSIDCGTLSTGQSRLNLDLETQDSTTVWVVDETKSTDHPPLN